ncbi:hypothetical protein [Dyadobacter fanqingshengii]|uniref:hypothetical protein n=1 Tax=Dyadobacter fanqingshengii TaxID=2906443 RepID=UPI00286E1EF0|nr:hypothetical protein [Dyadobacter fanqingshengii]
MNSNEDSLHTLNEIRSLMERSSKFLSLSGLSGVFIGIFALIGAGVAYVKFKTDWLAEIAAPVAPYSEGHREDVARFLIVDGCCVLFFSLAIGTILTVRKGKKRGLTVWNGSSKRLLVGMLVPLLTGGIFCLSMLLYHHMIWIVFPATLIFYGIALVNASKFTYPELFYMGICEIALGSLTLFLTNYSLLFWSLGFGVLHIIYGLAMYNRYEREKITATSKSSAKGLFGILFVLASFACNAQSPSDSTLRQVKRWYDKETIYLQGNGYIKDNVYYRGQRALKNEFAFSQGGFELFRKSRRTRGIATVISVAGAIGSISSLVSGNRNNVKTFFWVSLGTGLVSTILTVQANSQRDQAIWLRNRDAMLFLEANK